MAELPSASARSVTDEQWEQLVAKENAVKAAIDAMFAVQNSDAVFIRMGQMLQRQKAIQQELQNNINKFNAMSLEEKSALDRQEWDDYVEAIKNKKSTDRFVNGLEIRYAKLKAQRVKYHSAVHQAEIQYRKVLDEAISCYQEIFKSADYDLTNEDIREILSIKDLLYSSVPELQQFPMPWIKKGELLEKDLVKMLFPEAKDADIVKARFLSVFWTITKQQLHPDLPDYITNDPSITKSWTGQITDDFLHLMPDVKMPKLTLEDARLEGTVLFSRMLAKAATVQVYRDYFPEFRAMVMEDVVDPNIDKGQEIVDLRDEIERQAISRMEPYYGGGVLPAKDKNEEGKSRSEARLNAEKRAYIEAYDEELASMIKSEAEPLFDLVTGRIIAQVKGTEAESPYYMPLPRDKEGGIAGDEEAWREEQDELWDSVSIEAEG